MVIANGQLYVSAYGGGTTAYAPLAGTGADALRRVSRAPSPFSLVPDRDLKVTRNEATD